MSSYDTLDETRRKKLPRFAQDYMAGLEARIRELEGLQVRQEKTAVSFGFTMKCDEEGYLPEHSNVRFDLGKNGVVECYRRKTNGQLVLDVHGNSNAIMLFPQASNSVYITEEPKP